MADGGGHRAGGRLRGWWRRYSRAIRLVALVLVILLVAGVGVSVFRNTSAPTVSALRKQAGWADLERLSVGVNGDVPGLSDCKTADATTRCTGFDVEIAYLVAEWLGVRRSDVTFVRVIPEQRQRMQGRSFETEHLVDLDMVVAAFSITDKREKEDHVVFAGPYLTTETTVLTRQEHAQVDDLSALDQPLAGRPQKVCTPGTSTSNDYLHQTLRQADIEPKQQNSVCVAELLAGQVDAVVTDAAILAGFQAAHPKELRLNNIASEDDEHYGIGLGQDLSGSNPRLAARRQLVLLALKDLYDHPGPDNSWDKAFEDNLPPTAAGDNVQVVADNRQPEPLGLEPVRRWPWERTGSGAG